MESKPEMKSEQKTVQCPCQGCGMGQCYGCRMYGCSGCPYARRCGYRRGCGRCRFCRSGRPYSCPVQGVTNLDAMEYFDGGSMLTFDRIMLILILILVIYIAMKHYKE